MDGTTDKCTRLVVHVWNLQWEINFSYSWSIGQGKIIFVQDKIRIVLDQIFFVWSKKLCPRTKKFIIACELNEKWHFTSRKNICPGQKLFCSCQFWSYPWQKQLCSGHLEMKRSFDLSFIMDSHKIHI